MKILVLDILLSQASTSRIPQDVLPRIYKEYKNLDDLEKNGKNNIIKYLKNRQGIEMKGAEHIWKYHLTDGDRILYSYGKYFNNPNIEQNSLVLLGYAKHDDQGYFAKNTNFFNRNNARATHVKELLKDINDFSVFDFDEDNFNLEDLYTLATIWDENNVTDHYFSVVNDETFANLSPEQYDRVLTEEQKTCIDEFMKNPSPTLILGGAGTGKTVIGVRLMNAFQTENYEQKGAYITQSYELRHKVKSIYEGISHDDINCIDINDFCIEKLGKSRKSFIETQQFLNKFFSVNIDLYKKCEKVSIDPMDVWTEIRGVIKGSMNPSWGRNCPQKQDKYGRNVENLVAKGYFKRCKDDLRLFILADDINALIAKAKDDNGLSKDEKETLRKAFEYFKDLDPFKVELTKEEYLDLRDENSTIDYSKRSYVYEIYEKYKQFLLENEFFDDNDIARETYKKLTADDKFDFLFVDEVQDYTELQLFLIKALCKNMKQIVFAGDSNQNVNPTLFNEDRLKLLYCDSNKTFLNTKHLSANHRCSKEVVSIANIISKLRKETIGSINQLSEVDACSLRSGNPVFRLKYSKDNIKKLVEELSKYPGTAILVPNEKIKDLIKIADKNIIYTVSEIKGMEYQYVVCYDLFGYFDNVWKMIFSGKTELKHKTKYRFYFNLIYVAMTRSTANLCFIDSKDTKNIDEILKLNNLDKFDKDKMYFSSLRNDLYDWYSWAKDYEANGKYEDAIKAYSESGRYANEKDIFRCEAKMAEGERNFTKAVKYFLLSGNKERAFELSKEIGSNSDLMYLVSIISRKNIVFHKNRNISSIIEHEFLGISENGTEEIKKVVIDSLEKITSEKISEFSVLSNSLKWRDNNGNNCKR